MFGYSVAQKIFEHTKRERSLRTAPGSLDLTTNFVNPLPKTLSEQCYYYNISNLPSVESLRNNLKDLSTEHCFSIFLSRVHWPVSRIIFHAPFPIYFSSITLPVKMAFVVIFFLYDCVSCQFNNLAGGRVACWFLATCLEVRMAESS